MATSTIKKQTETPLVLSIPTGQWSGSGSDYYITVTASNVTANSILVPHYDNTSAASLKGPVWCVPAAGSFTIHTTAVPYGTVTISVMLYGTVGTAQYQVLSDVYSKAQTNNLIAQSTARDTWITSTTSFVACTHPTGISDNFGIALDRLHANISAYTNDQTTTTRLTSDGPLFGVSFVKANNNYYGGILFGYYGDVVFAFKYSNGTYAIRFL